MRLAPRVHLGLPALLAALLGAANAEAATVTGTITWSKPRAPVALTIARDRHVCAAAPIFDLEVAVDAKHRVAGVVVWLDDVGARPVAPRDATIDQVGCRFVPRVAVATVGGTLRFHSSDPVLHNVHVVDAERRDVANWAMPVMGQEVRVPLTKPGELAVRCDAGHTWMRAAVRVFEHPFFTTTDAAGAFTLPDVPPGAHKLVAWHPDLGRVERALVVAEAPPGAPPVQVELAF